MKSTGMIDVGGKEQTQRMARAMGIIKLGGELIKKIKNNTMPKGNVLENARVSAILAAKKTSELIPLCHNIELEYAGVDFELEKGRIVVTSLIRATSRTGVEMEALVACSTACLTIYDMCKMFSKSIEIQNIYLLEKRGGKSGDYVRK